MAESEIIIIEEGNVVVEVKEYSGNSSGGDMLKSTYDTDNSGVVDDAEKVNGLTVEAAVPSGALFTDTQVDIQAGSNVTIDKTNPLQPVISLDGDNNDKGGLTPDEKRQALLIPIGGKAFSKGAAWGTIKEYTKYPVKGDFSIVRQGYYGTNNYDGGIFLFQNDEGDRIGMYNVGYVWTTLIHKDGVEVYKNEIQSSVLFTGATNEKVVVSIDYTSNKIELSYDGFSYTWDIPELSQIKDSSFDNIRSFIDSYEGNTRDWYVIRGVYEYESISALYPKDSKEVIIKSVFKNLHSDVNLIDNPSTSLLYKGLSAPYNSFVNGEFTVNAADIVNSGYQYLNVEGQNIKYELLEQETMLNKSFISKWSIDIHSGELLLKKGNTTQVHIRAVEKDTNQVIMASGNITIMTLPVGRWDIQNTFISNYSYPSYYLQINGDDPTLSFTVYDDLEVKASAVQLSCIPEQSSLSDMFCPFTDQLWSSGTWIITDIWY